MLGTVPAPLMPLSLASRSLGSSNLFSQTLSRLCTSAQTCSPEIGQQANVQLDKLQKALDLLHETEATARQFGALTSVSASFRDLAVTLGSLHARQAGVTQPLTAGPHQAARAARTPIDHPRGRVCPVPDFSKTSFTQRPSDEPQLDQRYMDKISCWMQTLPSHVEMSYPLLTGIKVAPPEEASYPTYVDFDAAMRMLARHRSSRRLKQQKRLRRVQDKYQLRTWEHYKGDG